MFERSERAYVVLMPSILWAGYRASLVGAGGGGGGDAGECVEGGRY